MENPAFVPYKWYHYLSAFFSGAFFANTVPHFVNGISGNNFPTPFAEPPGIGLSSPLVNILWALVNLLLAYYLYRASRLSARTKGLLIVFFVGIAAMSINLALFFGGQMK